MSDIVKEQTVFNGWRVFVPSLAGWSASKVYWAFHRETRKTFPVLYERPSSVTDRVGWFHPDGTHLLASEADYVVPITDFPPPAPDTEVFRNPLPVVVMLVPTDKGIVVIRRALRDGYGKLALPGGFQNLGETWQQAGCREFEEETGVSINPDRIKVYDVVTVEGGKVNLIFGVYEGVVENPTFSHDEEIMEVLEFSQPLDTAFPAHTDMIARYLGHIEEQSA